jgi:hypothetical protein
MRFGEGQGGRVAVSSPTELGSILLGLPPDLRPGLLSTALPGFVRGGNWGRDRGWGGVRRSDFARQRLLRRLSLFALLIAAIVELLV